ncbi:MAG: alpha/beta fold hydrolase [Gammaproteobacteria bacterium]
MSSTSKHSAGRVDLTWEALEEQLAAPGRRARRRTTRGAEVPLEQIFEADELAKLRRLARNARRLRARTPVLGNVIFLHGITGADLCSIDRGGDRSDVWVSVPGLIVGRIERLQLAADGVRNFLPAYRVEPTGLNHRYYAQAVLTLRARWNVVPFAYDWRKDMDVSADALSELIKSKFSGQPVHLVAHSMGGLVARNFIRRHRALWKSMADENHVSGGRLIMLGTPNYGSFAIPQVMSGTDTLLSWLALLDLRHNLPELLAITNSFVGTYQLLPAPSKLPPTLQSLYQRDTWGSIAGVSQAHLKRAFDFHFDLEQAQTIDPTRMVYIAGCRQVTPSGCSVVSRGDFDYQQTEDGDGRVTHVLGLLKDVPTYYVDEAHGDLARNEAVLAAVDEVLQSGRTSNLPATVLRGVARGVRGPRDRRVVLERQFGADIRRVSALVRASTKPEKALNLEDQKLVAAAIASAAMGGSRDVSGKKVGNSRTLAAPRLRPQPKLPLQVRLRWGDITAVRSPMIVVGHYRGVPPVNAIGAVDRKLDGWINLAVRQGMIAGSLGETFLIPTRGRLPAEAVMVAGMGDAGEFTYDSLHVLMANVAIGAAGLRLEKLTTLLVGWGEGNLDGDSALRGQLEGIGSGLAQFRDEQEGRLPCLHELELVELKAHKFLELCVRLQDLAKADALGSVKLQFTVPSTRVIAQAERWQAQLNRSNARQTKAGARAIQPGATLPDVRLAVERAAGDPGLFRFAALSQKAVVPVREVRVNNDYVQGATEALQNAVSRTDQEKYGRLLYTYLMPEDFQDLIDGEAPIRLIVDSSTAGLPWEMACYSSRRARRSLRWLGLDQQLSRQFRTLLSTAGCDAAVFRSSARAGDWRPGARAGVAIAWCPR